MVKNASWNSVVFEECDFSPLRQGDKWRLLHDVEDILRTLGSVPGLKTFNQTEIGRST